MAKSMILITTKPRQPVLCRKQTVYQLEQEASEVTPQSFHPSQSPRLPPVSAGVEQLYSARNERWWLVISSWRHEDLVFHQNSVTLLSCHSSNVQWSIFLVMANGGEESMVIIGSCSRVGQTVFSHHMVPKQDLMEQIVLKVRISSCL